MIHRHSLPIIVWLFLTGCEGSVIDAERDLYRDTTDVSGTVNYTQDREPCADRHPLRHLYFGDLHAHTALSFDVYAYGVRVDGDGAFAFARGEPVRLPPLDADGIGTREATIDTPLDFAAITDHQEFIAEVDLCATPGNGAYLTDICARLRAGGDDVAMDFGLQLAKEHPLRMADICAAPGVDCDLAARDVWASIVQTARAHDDTTAACSFTAFAAYEYTSSMPALANNHRNVIFRNDDVPSLPPSFFEAPTEEDLWSQLRERCALAGGLCDAIVIPHNTNWSNGNMFLPDLSQGSLEEQVEAARLRAQMEPAIEIFQHKGDMEADDRFAGSANDPLSAFEKIRGDDAPDCGDQPGSGGIAGMGCVSRYDFVRNILKLGLREYGRLGVNPYMLGIVGGTDTHNGTPGHVAEWSFGGHVGTADDTPAKRLGPPTATHNMRVYNPGGLTAVWAVENSRDAIFEALRRRETYSTSGPRIEVRFFGSWVYDDGLCDAADPIARAYDRGVPMGGVLPPRWLRHSKPVFFVRARKAEGTSSRPGTPLQRIQIVKGWIDATGAEQERIYDVAGDPENGASVNRSTCGRSGTGFDVLCAVWQDRDFDADAPSFYYARVVENPSCSWRQYDCNRFATDDPLRPPDCDAADLDFVIQERAITSPVWYLPAATSPPEGIR